MTQLCDYEEVVLRDLGGEKGLDVSWGAVLLEAAKALHRKGYLTSPPNYQLTDEGRKKARELTTKPWKPKGLKA